jgi:hypothetical protein
VYETFPDQLLASEILSQDLPVRNLPMSVDAMKVLLSFRRIFSPRLAMFSTYALQSASLTRRSLYVGVLAKVRTTYSSDILVLTGYS